MHLWGMQQVKYKAVTMFQRTSSTFHQNVIKTDGSFRFRWKIKNNEPLCETYLFWRDFGKAERERKFYRKFYLFYASMSKVLAVIKYV